MTTLKTFILLGAMSPMMAGIIFLVIGFIVQTTFILLWLGALKLLRLNVTKKTFRTSFIMCSLFTIFVTLNNSMDGSIVKSFQLILQKTYSSAEVGTLKPANYKIQPLTIIITWIIICAVTTLTSKTISRRKVIACKNKTVS